MKDTTPTKTELRELIARMESALSEINLMACYASEEDIDSREAMLLKIGETARAACPGMGQSLKSDCCRGLAPPSECKRECGGTQPPDSGTSDAERRLRRFAELAEAVEGKAEGFGSQLTADRELGFLREKFLGELAMGTDPYTAFCRAIDEVSDAQTDVHKPGDAEAALDAMTRNAEELGLYDEPQAGGSSRRTS